MATPSPNRSAYRERRIHAMLNEGVADSPPPPQQAPPLPPPQQTLSPPPPPRRQNPPPAQRPLRVETPPAPGNRRRLVYMGSAAALLCSLAVFFLLFRQDRSTVSNPRLPEHSSTAGPVMSPPVRSTPAPVVSSPPTDVSTGQEPAPEPVPFKISRSRAFERVGPIRLRLVKANLKRGTCDVYIAAGRRPYQKQLQLNKLVQIELPSGSRSAELIVTKIGKDQVSGLVQ